MSSAQKMLGPILMKKKIPLMSFIMVEATSVHPAMA